MEQLKVEMVKRAHEMGDTGTGETHRKWAGMFLSQLQRWMTPEAIETFTADDLRGPYVAFVRYFLATGDEGKAGGTLMMFFHARDFSRNRAVSRTPDDPKVVSIFGKS